jgi:uncharacterized short protein YbdD (DUF466 family)
MRATMGRQSGGYQVWLRNDLAVEQALLANYPAETELTNYGENDSVLDYLMASGLWSILTGMEADGLKCGNGYRPSVLNGIEVIRELAGIGRIQHCRKILSDTRLMMQAGFNLARVNRATQAGRSVVDPETLANHMNRISPDSVQRTCIEFVRELRKRRLIRGKVYAADAHEIIVRYGRSHEQIGHVGAKYGFKLVILINVLEDRERIVGFAMASLQTSERAMLLEILERLNREVAPLGEWIGTLLLDRGYWGAKYLLGLKERYHIDVVTRAQHDGLEVVDYIEASLAEANWQETNEEHSRFGAIRIRSAGVKDVPLYDEKDNPLGCVNAVVVDEYDLAGKRLKDEKGKERPRFYYVTTMALPRRVAGIRDAYRKRWVIENQGFRELVQDWSLNILAGRQFNANYVRIGFVLMLYSAERIMRMKDKTGWQQERERVRQMIGQGWLGGLNVVVYLPEGHMGLFKVRQYGEIIRRAERGRITALMRIHHRQEGDLKDLLDKIKP